MDTMLQVSEVVDQIREASNAAAAEIDIGDSVSQVGYNEANYQQTNEPMMYNEVDDRGDNRSSVSRRSALKRSIISLDLCYNSLFHNGFPLPPLLLYVEKGLQ